MMGFSCCASVAVGADDLARLDRVEGDPGLRIDGVLDEMDGAVTEETVNPAGVSAPRAGESRVVAVMVCAAHGSPWTGSLTHEVESPSWSKPLYCPRMSVTPLGVNRELNELLPAPTDHMRPLTSLAVPWSTSDMKTVLLEPSVTEANVIVPRCPKADCR